MVEKLTFIPQRLMFALCRIDSDDLTDIYFTAYEPLTVRVGAALSFVGKEGMTSDAGNSVCVTAEEIDYMLYHACECAVYAHEDELKYGYVSLSEGNRLGVCGSPVIKDGHITSVTEVTSLCVRLAHEKKHCADAIMPYCIRDGKPVTSVLFSPPGYGKTTLLRDMIRSLSDSGFLVSCIDCRNEIAGTVARKRTFDLGNHCLCCTGYDKSTGIETAVRTQRPDIVAFDEIGQEEKAIRRGRELGVSFLFTAHADFLETLLRREGIAEMIRDGVIQTVIEIKKGYVPCLVWQEGKKI